MFCFPGRLPERWRGCSHDDADRSPCLREIQGGVFKIATKTAHLHSGPSVPASSGRLSGSAGRLGIAKETLLDLWATTVDALPDVVPPTVMGIFGGITKDLA